MLQQVKSPFYCCRSHLWLKDNTLDALNRLFLQNSKDDDQSELSGSAEDANGANGSEDESSDE